MSYDELVAKAAVYRGEDCSTSPFIEHSWVDTPEIGSDDLKTCTTCGAEQ
ncbi:hypothetical protein [Williamsia sp. D3]|nr:hypothetical protein [Williamsia sp. D3]ETD31519.1 hypothetical protein W823_19210 [Williamsia sp. D3]